MPGNGVDGGRAGGRNEKGQQETFQRDEYIHHLDRADNLTGVYIRQFIKLHTSNKCSFSYVSYASINLLKWFCMDHIFK